MLCDSHENIFFMSAKKISKKIQKSKFLILITTISIEKLSSPIENIFQVDLKNMKTTF